MEKRVCIVNFNTPELVEAAILSLWKNTPDAKVTVFDNSDEAPCFSMNGVDVLDNTKGQILNFERLLADYPEKLPDARNYGSFKHCLSIEYCFKLFKEGFLLLDSDVLVKKDVSDLFDSSVAWVGYPHITRKHLINVRRIYPFCCFINTKMCIKNGVHYFDSKRIWHLCGEGKNSWYDTGASFLEDCEKRGLKGRCMNLSDYIVHLGHGNANSVESRAQWLDENKNLYEKSKTMDILYIYGKRNKSLDDFELRCSLRSIAEHGKNIGKVYIVGKTPTWLSDEVIKIPHYKQLFPYPKNQGEKNANIADNVFYAVKNSDIGDEFLVSHDDHFYIKDVDFGNYPYYAREFRGSGELITRDRANSEYRQFLADTREFLEKHKLPTINFALHRNMHLNKEAVLNVEKLYEESIKQGKPIELYILANNWLLAHHPFEYTLQKDIKVMEEDQWWKADDKKTEVFSTADFKKDSSWRKNMKKLFPNKCKYEK